MSKIKYARLQASDYFIDGLGALGAVLPGSLTGAELRFSETGVYLTVRNIEAFIPIVNFKVIVFDKPQALSAAIKPVARLAGQV